MVKYDTSTVHTATCLSKAYKQAQRQPPSVTVFQFNLCKVVKYFYLCTGNPSGITSLFSLWAHIFQGLSSLLDVFANVKETLQNQNRHFKEVIVCVWLFFQLQLTLFWTSVLLSLKISAAWFRAPLTTRTGSIKAAPQGRRTTQFLGAVEVKQSNRRSITYVCELDTTASLLTSHCSQTLRKPSTGNSGNTGLNYHL